MRAIILAAGRGSRMRDATKDIPKCLLKIKDKTLLDLQIGALRKAGVKKIAVVTGYLSEQLLNHCEKRFHNYKWSETNMVFSLTCANSWLRESDCIVSYSDIFYNDRIVKKLIDCKSQISVAYDPGWKNLWQQRFDNPLTDAETFKISKNKYIIEIGNKTTKIDEIQGQYMGLMKFTIQGWSQLEKVIKNLSKKNFQKIQITQLLQKYINLGYEVKGISNEDKWGEIDTQKDLELYN